MELVYASERDNAPRHPSPYLSELQSKAKLNSGKMSDEDFSKLLETIRSYAKELKELEPNSNNISTNIADGWGLASGWQIRDTGNGFLLEVGYTARQGGPDTQERQTILADVFMVVSICQILLGCPLLKNGANQTAPIDCEKFETPSTLHLARKRPVDSPQFKPSRNGKLTWIILTTS